MDVVDVVDVGVRVDVRCKLQQRQDLQMQDATDERGLLLLSGLRWR